MLDAGYWMLDKHVFQQRSKYLTIKEQTSPLCVFNTYSDAAVRPTKAQLNICSHFVPKKQKWTFLGQ
jgi:hypothetical protein